MNKLLILEDNDDRIKAFKEVLAEHCPDVEYHIWKSALVMIDEVDEFLPGTTLISLDHDLVPETDIDPGDGRDFAKFLAQKEPICPVIIHSTNVNASYSMLYELMDGGWQGKKSSNRYGRSVDLQILD